MKDCIFCKIIAKEIPADIIYEDDAVIAFVDIKGLNPGHSLIVPKMHVTNLYEFDDATTSAVFGKVPMMARAIKHAMSADGINIGMNNDAAAAQAVFHAHVHIIPRHTGDGYASWSQNHSWTETQSEIATKIKNAL